MIAGALSRRRFLAISAAACAATGAGASPPVAAWLGQALGTRAEIRLAGLDAGEAAPLFAAVEAELARIDGLFSLFRADSALARLNRDGVLSDPPPDFLHLLSLARAVHEATEGAFDPTVQPIFALHAEAAAAGRRADPERLRALKSVVGFDHVRFDASAIRFDRAGVSMTLNGIAQGYATDRIASLLERAGMRDVLVNAGEIRAAGRPGAASGWPVRLPGGGIRRLENRAAATSQLSGTILDTARGIGHIFSPVDPALPLRTEPVTAFHDSAAVADAASTAAVVLDDRRLALLRRLDVEISIPG